MLAEQSYSDRVKNGKSKERIIINSIRRSGTQIDCPTEAEDMYSKIDGWIVENGKRKSIQIKFRENGNDIIFEVMKDVDRNINGRDLIGKADYYLCVDTFGNGRLFETKTFKDLAQKIKESIMPLINSTKTNWNFKQFEVKLTIDLAHGNRKLMCYFYPRSFQSLKIWKINLVQ